jgi:dihydropyrimidinase
VKTLIRDGRILTASQSYEGDVLVDGETIALVGRDLDAGGVDEVIDAGGKIVAPGGVDVHTHLDTPAMGTVTADDFRTGHIAAAIGGTTTHIDFAIQEAGETLQQAVDNWSAKAEGKACIDYGFHVAITDLPDERIEELDTMVERGVTSFKLFMAYKGAWMVDDATIFKTLRRSGANNGLVMFHCENGDAIDILVNDAVAAGHTEPKWHGLTRPSALEGEATNRAIALGKVAGGNVYIVHVTCREAVEAIARARRERSGVYGETCIQYLILTEAVLSQPGFEGAKFVCSPPFRSQDHVDRLWEAIANDELQVVSTDHAPFRMEQKELGKESFHLIPNGIPTAEHRLTLLWEHGVRSGRITPNRWVELVSTNPAKIFGLYPKKGDIAPGCDADLVIFDPDAEHVISAENHHMNCDYSVFEGMQASGAPETVLLRGEVIVEKGSFTSSREGRGRFVARDPFSNTVR